MGRSFELQRNLYRPPLPGRMPATPWLRIPFQRDKPNRVLLSRFDPKKFDLIQGFKEGTECLFTECISCSLI